MVTSYQAEKHATWEEYKTHAATQSALGVTERKAAQLANHTLFTIPKGMTKIEMRFKTDGGDGKTATAHVYGARKDDDICLIGDLSLISGQQIATDGSNYVQTIVPDDRWTTEIKLADHNGNDGMSRVMFYTLGYDVIFVRMEFGDAINWITDVSGS